MLSPLNYIIVVFHPGRILETAINIFYDDLNSEDHNFIIACKFVIGLI